MIEERIQLESLKDRIVTVEEAVSWIQDGMTIGFSGFTSSGDVKVVPRALVEHVKKVEKPLKLQLYTGASVSPEIDALLSEAGLISKRLPFQSDKVMRKKINAGEVMYIDQHLSNTADMIRNGSLSSIDLAVVEALQITKEGAIVPTTSGGNTAIFLQQAKEVIIELNLGQPLALKGVHDIYDPGNMGTRKPIPLTSVDQRIGHTEIQIDPAKIKGIVLTNILDTPKILTAPDVETEQIATHLINFLRTEIKQGRLPNPLPPLQSGVGSVANAVFHGFLHSEFSDLQIYSEVLQDAVFDLMDVGKIHFASGGSLTLSKEKTEEVFTHFEKYADKIILRPQELTNNPEIIRRLGLIAINTALEADIYGNVNSTHVMGTQIMNGIGGSADFTRNARLSIFVTKSIAKNGAISSIVPFASHIDNTEHDVQVIITEQGVADLRGLAPRERAILIINNCAHPSYRPQLMDYYERAIKQGGQTPHNLEEALSWHVRFTSTGSMQTVDSLVHSS
ncbi:MAG TPA: succinate CoA transferase [Bacillota bacterium]|nr:succinate CoA transferase [Bacillota bacterium]